PNRKCECAKYPAHKIAPALPSIHAHADAGPHHDHPSKMSECGCEHSRKAVARCRIDQGRSAMLPPFAGTTCQRANSARLRKWLRLKRGAQSRGHGRVPASAVIRSVLE